MMHGLSTGYFIWNILSWLFIYLFTAFMLCAVIYAASSRKASRLVQIPPAAVSSGFVTRGYEESVRAFRRKYFEPFSLHSCGHVAAIIAVVALLFVAVLSGGALR